MASREEMRSQPDLNALAAQASEEIRASNARLQSQRGKKKSHTGWKAFIAWGLLGALIVFSDMHVVPMRMFADAVAPARANQRVQQELYEVLDMARSAAETARVSDGAYPEVLPHAALAAIVRYQRTDSGYWMAVSSAGVTVSQDSAGNREVRAD